jgi:hypothetical protein
MSICIYTIFLKKCKRGLELLARQSQGGATERNPSTSLTSQLTFTFSSIRITVRLATIALKHQHVFLKTRENLVRELLLIHTEA